MTVGGPYSGRRESLTRDGLHFNSVYSGRVTVGSYAGLLNQYGCKSYVGSIPTARAFI